MKKISIYFFLFCILSFSLHSYYSDQFESEFEDYDQSFIEIHSIYLKDLEKSERVSKNIHSPRYDTKEQALNCASFAREAANTHLERSEVLIDKLKVMEEFRTRDRLKVLVASTIGVTLVKSPKDKFYTVALSLLADLAINEGFDKLEICYDIYKELACAAHCLEECKYFYRLSLDANEDVSDCEDYKLSLRIGPFMNTNFAIDFLTRADMYTLALEYKTESDIISYYIAKIRKSIMHDMYENRGIKHTYSDTIYDLMENFHEITADCSSKDRDLVHKIYLSLKNARSHMKLAEEKRKIR